jgi:glycosyltransferase involved in cell wall biosynthesis
LATGTKLIIVNIEKMDKQMKAKPRISIITINLNEPLLERTCQSVINQTFTDYEWIVIDGGSTNPKTLATLKKYKDHAAYFVSEPDGGLYDAMNKGIAQAHGEWLVFMNAGDCFYENSSLEKICPHIEKNKDCAVVYGGVLVEHKKKPKLHFIKQYMLGDLFFMHATIPHPSSFIRRDMFAKYGNYRDEFRVVSDWAKFAQMYWAGEKFKSVNKIVAKYNLDGISSTLNEDDIYMEYAKIWNEYQPWVFNSKSLKLRKHFYAVLRSIIFIGKLHQFFRSKRNLYKCLLKYTKMYQERFVKDKILFIDHSYHKKTHSTDFLVDLMKAHFNCDVMYDDSWESGKKFDAGKYDFAKYKHVIFFQLLPPWKDLRKIRHKSMFWFPMEEIMAMKQNSLRRRCKKLKIINFTKIGHKRVSELGGESLPVRFFIKPAEFAPGDPSKIFFWQRITDINIRNVANVLPDDRDFSLHLHMAIDPHHYFVQPRAREEKKYHITYSEWFPNKSDLVEKIKAAGIYIAPRKMEGIGMSFLEAMAMGKAIIAYDAGTMNEYIENGVNGYLVDFDKPEIVDLSNLEWVRKNAYETAKIGYIRWQNDQKKIIKFIKGELKND